MKVSPSIASEKPPLGCRWGGPHTGPALMDVTPATEAGGMGIRARKKGDFPFTFLVGIRRAGETS